MGAIFLGYSTLHHFSRIRAAVPGLEALAESALLRAFYARRPLANPSPSPSPPAPVSPLPLPLSQLEGGAGGAGGGRQLPGAARRLRRPLMTTGVAPLAR